MMIRRKIKSALRLLVGAKTFNDENKISMEKQMPTIIYDFEQLDTFINNYTHCNYEGSHYEFLRSYQIDFQSFVELFGKQPPNCDPFSEEYAQWEMSFHRFLSGKDYNYDLEGSGSPPENVPPTCWDWFDMDSRIHSMRTYADLLDVIRPKLDTTVLEMGVGWGNLAELLGRCGCIIYGVDACKSSVNYVKNRLDVQNINSCIIHGSFFDIEKLDTRFNVVIFESSFHHCAEPVRLLNVIKEKLSPDGRVYFFKDAISSDLDRPWGMVRYDGETMFQVRYRGWLELGYRMDFFEQALNKTGFKLEKEYWLESNASLLEVVNR